MNSGIRTVRIEQIKESVMKKAFWGLVTALSFGVVIAAVGCVANPASAVDEQVVETVEASVANVSAPHPAEVEGSQGSVIVPDYTAAQRLHPMAAERSAGQGTRSAIVVGTSQPIAIPGLAEAAAWQRIKAVAGSFQPVAAEVQALRTRVTDKGQTGPSELHPLLAEIAAGRAAVVDR